jgi:intein-encoded DNA endonuclease-like protein
MGNLKSFNEEVKEVKEAYKKEFIAKFLVSEDFMIE